MVIDVIVTKTRLWCAVIVLGIVVMGAESLNGANVCMVQQKYNITKRVKYRAPMSVRTYEWCFSMPPRCSKWKTEMRELTKLETDERIAEVAVCCPGYKMKDVSCVPICPNGKTGHRCSDDCPSNKWGPNCVNDCEPCNEGVCSPITGECSCQDGWQGESCEIRMPPSSGNTTTAEDLLTKSATKPNPPITPTIFSTRPASVFTTSTPLETTLSTISRLTLSESTTHPSRLKSEVEIPILLSNRTLSLGTHFFASSSPQSTTLVATKTLLDIPRTTTTIEPTTSGKIVSPTTTHKTTTSTTMKTTSGTSVTTALPPKVIATIQATTAPVKATTERLIVLSTTIKEDKPKEKITTTEKTITIKSTAVKAGQPIKKFDIIIPTTEESEKLTTFQQVMNRNPSTEIIEQTTRKLSKDFIYSRTDSRMTEKVMHEIQVPVKVTMDNIDTSRTTTQTKTFNNVSHTTSIMATDGNVKIETSKRPQSTIRYFPTTVKFKPKEIWIRPAQKGESFIKTKAEANLDLHSKPKTATQPTNTTPKTIIVSIIPTSVSYATFKKIALTTSSLLSEKTNLSVASPNANESPDQEVTKPMSILTTTEFPKTTLNGNVLQKFYITSKMNKTTVPTSNHEPHIDKTTKTFSTFNIMGEFPKSKTVSQNGTNSMATVDRNLNSSNSLTTTSTNATTQNTAQLAVTTRPTIGKSEKVTRPIKIVTVKPRNVTIITVSGKNKNETVVKITKTIAKDVEKTNATRIKDIIHTNQVTTESPDDEEFHILTEPEHITAVMEGKGKERASLDLVSVISIAGGIMMAVITVAVVIVMVERCKRPRYDDVRKVSDIRMQVMIDNNDEPPPYVRSIFHTPLPDPPTSEKCHYQPISTLDRNLKQFMRPVVVQTISPIMLENFRGILECHYDHLPRRSQIDTRHFSIAPSVDDVDELTHLRPCSAMDSTIEALKCEARLDVIDSTTSEPLYAEIPCWRPPSEHAIEIMNLNGEAVTEL